MKEASAASKDVLLKAAAVATVAARRVLCASENSARGQGACQSCGHGVGRIWCGGGADAQTDLEGHHGE